MPIWSHYCEMAGKNSLSECGDCKIEKVEIDSCCLENIPDDQYQLSTADSNCCVDTFDYKKIEDNFSQRISLRLIISSDIIGTKVDEEVNPENEKTQSYLNTYNLPSPKFGKQLLHTIHQLKIAVPVC